MALLHFVRSHWLERSGRDEIDKKSISARNTFRELTKKGEAGVDIDSVPKPCINEAAVQRWFVRVGHRKEGSIARIEIAPEIKATFLYPLIEIGLCDLVRSI